MPKDTASCAKRYSRFFNGVEVTTEAKCLCTGPQCFKLGPPAPHPPTLPQIEIPDREVWWKLSVHAMVLHLVFLMVGKNPELLVSGAMFQMNVSNEHMSVYLNDLHVPSRKNKPHTHVLVSHTGGMPCPTRRRLPFRVR